MPTTVNFDTLNHDAWTGHLTLTVLDNDGTPNRVLDRNHAWQIKVRWSLTSENAPDAPLTMVTQGHWRVEGFVESIGTGPGGYEGRLPWTPNSDPSGFWNEPWGAGGTASYKQWEQTFTIPAGVINQDGIYKVTVMIQYHLATNVFTSMVGFAEYPLICFNNPQIPA